MFLKFSHQNYPEACETLTPWAQPTVDDSLGLGWGPNCIPNKVSAVAAAILGTPFWSRGLLKDLDAVNLEVIPVKDQRVYNLDFTVGAEP